MTEERARLALTAALTVVALAAGALVGRATKRPQPVVSGAVRLIDGLPIGVEDTPAGALAAADNYVAIASETVEQNPNLFARLVAQAYAPSVRAVTLNQAAQIRGADPAGIANYVQGGRALAVIAARRLTHFSPGQATVSTWLGGFVWGPSVPAPHQSWNLVDTRLAWQAGRWVVTASTTQPTAAPVPAVVIVDGANNQTPVFEDRLAGMSAPFYGTAAN